MHVLDFFLTELQNIKVSLTLLKCDPDTDALPTILKFLRTNKGNTCGGISFQQSYKCVDWPVDFFKRNAIKDIFFDNFSKLS